MHFFGVSGRFWDVSGGCPGDCEYCLMGFNDESIDENPIIIILSR